MFGIWSKTDEEARNLEGIKILAVGYKNNGLSLAETLEMLQLDYKKKLTRQEQDAVKTVF